MYKPVVIQEPAEYSSLDWYEKWMVSLYEVEKFGGLQLVNPTMITIGICMVQLFKSTQVKLD